MLDSIIQIPSNSFFKMDFWTQLFKYQEKWIFSNGFLNLIIQISREMDFSNLLAW